MGGVYFLLMLLLVSFKLCTLNATQTFNYTSANISSSWQNNPFTDRGSLNFSDGTHVRPILLLFSDKNIPNLGFGFYQKGVNSKGQSMFHLAILKFPIKPIPVQASNNLLPPPPIVLWCAPRYAPFGENATLDLTVKGNLVLQRADGEVAWSTNTNGLNVTHLRLGRDGNLRLVDDKDVEFWQSFDHPTDVWLPGQILSNDQAMRSSESFSSWAVGKFYFRIGENAINAFIDPGQKFKTFFSYKRYNFSLNFGIGSLNYNSEGRFVSYNSSSVEDFQFIRLEPNGHLNVYQLVDGYNISLVSSLLRDKSEGDCVYPTVCGDYGVCSNGGQCRCPGNSSYFKQSEGSSDCVELTKLSCQDTHLHGFLELKNVTYFKFITDHAFVDVETCKRACMGNCRCKAVVFRYASSGERIGNCSVLKTGEFHSLKDVSYYETKESFVVTFFKVQTPSKHKHSHRSVLVLLVPFVFGFLVLFGFMFGVCRYYGKRCKKDSSLETLSHRDRDSFHIMSNMLRKFTFEELITATRDFQRMLGRGGFGFVYEGNLENGTKVAVKRLHHDLRQGKKEYMAEVETIGGLHHFNLVRLIGFCSQNTNRLLVYEYLTNGSLDKWIFTRNRAETLDWDTRFKIILGIAKGLEYLHDHCNRNIIHFDIKPQNILLDKDFNPKISDFGLARYYEKDQTHVSTLLKGTPGYIAPELIQGKNITPKADVFSFGVMILETVSGFKNSHYFPPEDSYLIDMLKIKAEQDKLSDLVDVRNRNMESCKNDAVKIMKVAISCLQSNIRKRPSASKIVKVLEGLVDLEPVTDYGFLGSNVYIDLPMEVVDGGDITLLPPCNLSGPR